MKPAWLEEVLDPGFLRGLDGLALARRRSRPGAPGGPPGRSPRASGLDWVDHRPYEPGDDLRYLDWNLYARIGRPYVRRFLAERAERLDLLVDSSASMALGRPAKHEVACALAFVLGYVALSAGERVGATFFADRLGDRLPAGRGPAHRARLLEFLARARPAGKTGFRPSLESFAALASELGQVVVVSDLLAEGLEAGLSSLRARGFEVAVVRLRAGCDEEPDLPGTPLTVMDIETGSRRNVSLAAGDRDRYRRLRRMEAERTASFCGTARVQLASLGTWRRLPDLVFRDLRESGLLA